MSTTIEKLNGFGSLFRLITPTLIAVIGTLILTGQNDVKTKLSDLNSHFINHLAHHQDLEVGYEKRITTIEGNRFTDEDGRKLEERIMNKVPPEWLIDRIEKLEKKRR